MVYKLPDHQRLGDCCGGRAASSGGFIQMWFVVASLGVAGLLFLCFAVFVLVTNPYEYVRLSHLSSKANFIYRYVMLFIPPLFIWIGAYQVVFFLCEWMPSDWGNFADGEYITIQSSISFTISFIIGYLITQTIGRGISAQVQLSELNLKSFIKKNVNKHKKPKALEMLQAQRDKLNNFDEMFVEDTELYHAIKASKLPISKVREIYSDLIVNLTQKLKSELTPDLANSPQGKETI